MRKPRKKIKYVEWGVANVYKDGTIEMHKDLKLEKYKALRRKILYHELDHDFGKGFWYNLQVDLFHTIGPSGLFSFMASRPRTWIQMLPFYYNTKHGLIYDKNLTTFWGLIVLGVICLIKFT